MLNRLPRNNLYPIIAGTRFEFICSSAGMPQTAKYEVTAFVA